MVAISHVKYEAYKHAISKGIKYMKYIRFPQKHAPCLSYEFSLGGNSIKIYISHQSLFLQLDHQGMPQSTAKR